MSKSKDYIPASIAKFNEFQTNFVTKVVAGAVAWAIAAGKVTALQAAQAIYVALYNAIADPATKTKGAIHAHRVGMNTFIKYIRTFVNENIRGNAVITAQERIDMGLNPGDGTKTPRPDILTAPVAIITPMGNGVVHFECRVVGDDSRPSIQADADGLEFRFSQGEVPPAGLEETNHTFFSTKARFNKIAEQHEIGKKNYFFARWKNTSDDTKSGPWCPMVTITIR